ncbi:DEKNAAC101824 [Brettanomyces naardenensis]|uniref:DEKNAAC101824 n=1 Tax=Brettanomyces naardenensis TaxID=13370 RepID=A0A448YJ54_BRENA|nr:DEKNAAC101824 [Brettanomyces naardenensis]
MSIRGHLNSSQRSSSSADENIKRNPKVVRAAAATHRKALSLISRNEINTRQRKIPTDIKGLHEYIEERRRVSSEKAERKHEELGTKAAEEVKKAKDTDDKHRPSGEERKLHVFRDAEDSPKKEKKSHIFEVEELKDEREEDEEETKHSRKGSGALVVPMSPKWDDRIEKDLESVIYEFYRPDPDPEDEDTWDVSMAAEYAPEIFNHLRDLESKYAPYAYYVPEIQTDITWENRSTLINWIVQVHSRFNLLPETLFLTVNIVDRFLSKRAISLSKFQLCGAVALFIAAKYEEINCPTVKQMAFMVSNEYTTAELLKAEKFMITELRFDMGYPGPMSFLRRTSKADNYDSEIRTLAKYFLEITIMDSRLVASPPSWLAAGASYLSLKMLHQGHWTDAHVYYSGYTEEQLAPLAEVLVECCINYRTHHKAIFDKYSERRFKRSALFVQDYLKRELE